MKNEKKLTTAIMYTEYVEQAQNLETAQKWAKDIRTMIHEFLTDNTTTGRKGTFNINDYTHPNSDRYHVLSGICYDPATKSAVACDSYLLVVDRAAYDQELVDKFKDDLDVNGRLTLDKYGNRIESTYPNYPSVFPDFYGEIASKEYTIDIDDLQDYIKRCRAFLKMEGYNNNDIKRRKFIYQIGTAYFEAYRLLSFAIASEGHIRIVSHDRAAFWRSEERDALVMPVCPPAPTELMENDLDLMIKYN